MTDISVTAWDARNWHEVYHRGINHWLKCSISGDHEGAQTVLQRAVAARDERDRYCRLIEAQEQERDSVHETENKAR
jgi:hypothetical protein